MYARTCQVNSPAPRYMPGSSEPTKAVLYVLSPKYSKNSTYITPNEKHTPSTMMLHINDASTTIQPQPPSGGSGGSGSDDVTVS